MTDDVVVEQVGYYRRRAREYDATAYGDVDAARGRIAGLVAEMRPTGRVLEIACGTGLWTEALARTAGTLTAIDAAPEVLEIARGRVPGATFEVADVFTWNPGRRFDTIFFSAWLSHVPAERFAGFWESLAGLLDEGGRVLFIDEHVDEREKETYLEDRTEIVERRLTDGTSFHIVKNFIDPTDVRRRLHDLGWRCTVERVGTDWVRGEARR